MMLVGEAYDLHFDESKFGSGHRSVVVITAGRKWITCIDPSTLTIGKVIASEWPLHKPRLIAVKPRQMARRIEAQAKAFKSMDLKFAKKAVKRFVQELKTL